MTLKNLKFLIFVLSLPTCVHDTKQKDKLKIFLTKDHVELSLNLLNNASTSYKKYKNIISDVKKATTDGQWNRSIKVIKLFLGRHPYDNLAMSLLAFSYYKSGSLRKAAYFSKLVLNKDQDNPIALNLLGIMLLKKSKILNDFRNAKTHFYQAFQNNPTEIAAGLNLAYLQLSLGNALAAEKTFLELSKRCDSCAIASLGLAISYMRLEKPLQAKNLLETLQKSQKLHAISSYHLALYSKNILHDKEHSNSILKEALQTDRLHNNSEIKKRIKELIDSNSQQL